MESAYPIVVPLSAALKYDFAQSEFGAYEDDGHPETGAHPYLVASRPGKNLRIDNQEELRTVWLALCSGTFQMAEHHFRAACRIADQLKPHVEAAGFDKLLSTWPYPSGY